MGGYEANFNPPLEDKYKCPICLTALKDPVQTKCGHRLCLSCFKTIRGCPVDNTWSNHVFDDNAVKREILSLKVDCTNNVTNNCLNKCEWSGELRELQNHLNNCSFEQVECPNKCKSNIMRIDFDKHLLECPLRLEKCEHCHVEVVATQLVRHHVLICPKFPVNCPICGEADIMRENVNAHINVISGDCPMVVVPCSFRHIGCLHQDQRCKMAKHYNDYNTQHIMLLSTRLVDLETKHRVDLEVCTNKFDTVISELKHRLDLSERKNKQLEEQLKEEEIKNETIENIDISLGKIDSNYIATV